MTVSRARSPLARLGVRLLRTRWIVRVPVGLYRARLGGLCGSRLILLEHRGRTTGASRYVVLEVVARPGPDTIVVASAFGTHAQWYRNMQADPAVRVTQGSQRPRSAQARTLGPAESARALRRYTHAYLHAWHKPKPIFEATLGSQISDRTSLPLVAIDLGAVRFFV